MISYLIKILKAPLVFYYQFQELNRFKKEIENIDQDQKIVFFDIDNTLALTWPSLLTSYSNENERLLSLAVNLNSYRYFLSENNNSNNAVFFLSHRSFKQRGTTSTWLESNFHFNCDNLLFLVSSPKLKLKFIKIALGKFKQVTLVDDLSYNHENGQVKRYDALIKKINELPIEYLGLDFLQDLDNSNYYYHIRK